MVAKKKEPKVCTGPLGPTDEDGHPNAFVAEQIQTMSGLGLPVQMIAQICQMSPTTLYKYYTEDLKLGKSQACLKVAKRLFLMATDEEVDERVQFQALRFWAQTQMGWKESMNLEVSGQVEHTHKQIHIHFVESEINIGQTEKTIGGGASQEQLSQALPDEGQAGAKLDALSPRSPQPAFI